MSSEKYSNISELAVAFTGLIAPAWEFITRDFSYTRFFGRYPIEDVPLKDFDVAKPLGIKQQFTSDLCGPCALAAIKEDLIGVEVSPEYSQARIKQIQGDYKIRGADPRSICKAATKFGFLLQSDSPYKINEKNRDEVSNPSNWDRQYDEKASVLRERSFFKLDGYWNKHDSVRSVLYQHYLAENKRTVLAGIRWQSEWTSAPGGVIPLANKGSSSYDHMVKIFGQKVIGGKPYLKIQDSRGTGSGDSGLYYLPREQSRQVLWASVFMNIDPDFVKQNWDRLQKLKDAFIKVINEIKS